MPDESPRPSASQVHSLVGRRPLPGGRFESVRVAIDDAVIAGVQTLPDDDPALPIISPGWLDLQCNGALGQDFGDPTADLSIVPRFLARHGVVGYLATVVTTALERYPAVLRRLAALPDGDGARFLGAHLEGPFLNPCYRGAHHPDWILAPDLTALREIALDPVRLITLAPELPGALDLVAEAGRRGIRVAAGHSAASFDQALESFAAGVSAGTHLFNAMPPLHHRAPGLAGALLLPESPPTGLIVDGCHVHPALVRLAWAARGPAGLFLVTDAIPSVGLPDGEYEMFGQRITMGPLGARLPGGRLAGSVLTMNCAIASLAACTGDLHGALLAASKTPARVLGLAARKGRLAAGYDADVVLLDDHLNVLETIIAGRSVYRAPGWSGRSR